MAVYTAFCSSPRPGTPYFDGVSYTAIIMTDVTVLASNGDLIGAYGSQDEQFANITIQSVAGLVPSDSINTIKAKVAAAIRVSWEPTITNTDTIKVVWMDSGGLLNL